MLFAAPLEEGTEECRRFWLQDPDGARVGVVEARICRKVVEGTGSAGFGIRGSVDETSYARSVEGPGTHRAGFEGGVEGTVRETPGIKLVSGATEGEELGVSGRVFRRLALVVGDR